MKPGTKRAKETVPVTLLPKSVIKGRLMIYEVATPAAVTMY